MKRILIYIPLLLTLLACSEEDTGLSGKQPETAVRVPFSISVSSATDKGLGTRASGNAEELPGISGSTDVDFLKICVFVNESGEDNDNPEKFLYVPDLVTVTKQIGEAGEYKAEGYITPVEGKPDATYRILALAYKQANKSWLDWGKFTEGVSLQKVTVELVAGGFTPELFAGYLYKVTEKTQASSIDENVEKAVFESIASIDGNTKLEGYLFRAVSRVSVELSGIPDEVKSLSLVSQKYRTSSPVYNSTFLNELQNVGGARYYCYPMGSPFESIGESMTTVATVAKNEITNGEATLQAYFFPMENYGMGEDRIENRTYFYVDVETGKGKHRLHVKAPDTEPVETIWHGIFERLVESNAFILRINWQIKLSGSYDTLASGNLLIDEGEMGTAEGGALEPKE